MNSYKSLLIGLFACSAFSACLAMPFGLPKLKTPEIPGIGHGQGHGQGLGHGQGHGLGLGHGQGQGLGLGHGQGQGLGLGHGSGPVDILQNIQPTLPSVPDLNNPLLGNLPTAPSPDILQNVPELVVPDAIQPILSQETPVPAIPDILSKIPKKPSRDLIGDASLPLPSTNTFKDALEGNPPILGDASGAENSHSLKNNLLEGLVPQPSNFLPSQLIGNSGNNQSGGLDLMSLSPFQLQELLKSMASAAAMASNSSTQLTGIISSVSDGARAIASQVDMLHNLTEQLGKEVSKPLAAIQPFVDAQVHLATTITSSVESLIKDIQQMVHDLLSLRFLVIILIGISGFSSLLGIIIILLQCSSRRTVVKSMRNSRRIAEGFVGKPGLM